MKLAMLSSSSSTRLLGSALLVVSLASGCGGSAPSAAKTPVPEADGKEDGRGPLEEAADLSPVAAPKNLVLVGRMSRPITVVDTATRWAGLPLSVRQLLGEHAWIEPVVAWDAPVQAAGMVEGKSTPEPIFVVTVGLTGVDAAVAALRDQGHSLRRVAPGIYQIAGDEPSCFVAASRGQAPARLVCGENSRAVERLLPYATRGLPDLPASKSDLEIEFTAAPLQQMFAQQLSSLTFLSGFVIRQASIDHAGFDRALADAVYALASEVQVLANDVDRVRIEGKLDEASSVIDLSVALGLRSDKSWTGQLLAEAAQRSGPAPESFWMLPDQVNSASYAMNVDPARFKPIARTLGDLADGFLDKQKVPRASREKVKTALADLFTSSAPVVQGEGKLTEAKPAEPTAQQYVADLVGWQLLVSEGPSEPILRAYRGLANVLNDRDLRRMLAKEIDLDAKLLPSASERAFAAKGAPAGGRVFTFSVPRGLVEKLNKEASQAPKAKPSPVQLVLVVVPDGKRTIIVLAPDEKIAGERIVAFKAGKEPTLAQRQDLASLRTNRAFAAGFGSLAGIAGQLASFAERAGGGSQVLAAVPHRGRTPILSSLVVEKGGGVTVKLNVRLPKAVIEDGAALVPQLAPKF
jgi:hypothetical protein